MVDLRKTDTEQQNKNTINLDQMSVREALTVMNQEDKDNEGNSAAGRQGRR